METGLWTFSLTFYKLPGVEKACLRCQDEAGADVNLILFLLWRAASGILITGAQIGSVDAAVKDWREQIVKPLRTVRGRLKTENFASNFDEAGCFRSNIKAAELEAERLEQQVLERWAAPPESPPRQVSPIQATQANIAAYAAVIGRQLPHDSVEVFLNEIQGL